MTINKNLECLLIFLSISCNKDYWISKPHFIFSKFQKNASSTSILLPLVSLVHLANFSNLA